MPIPLKLALFGELTGEKYADRLVLLDERRKEIVLDGIGERPVLSINRDFSAPVVIETDRSAADLAFLSARDDNPFARYEAMQQLMLDTLIARDRQRRGRDHEPVIEAVRETLANEALDPAFIAEAVLLPSEAFIGDQMLVGRSRGDPRRARGAARRPRAASSSAQWRAAYDAQHRQPLRIFACRQGRAAAAHRRARLSDGGRARRTRRRWRCASSRAPTT